jgi:sulfur carrier protein ThiS
MPFLLRPIMIKVTLNHGRTIALEPGATVTQALQALEVAADRQVVAAPSAWIVPRVLRSYVIPPRT